MGFMLSGPTLFRSTMFVQDQMAKFVGSVESAAFGGFEGIQKYIRFMAGRSDRSLMEQLARVSKKLSSVGQIELLQMQSYPKFHNEIGVPIVRVGCREFECIGAIPPQDHPHIYLNMGDASGIVCPLG
jgi:uncharacterized Zn-finger protein